MEITLEQVERLREKANVSYTQARDALERSGGDLLEALIWLESQGAVPPPEGGRFYTTSPKAQARQILEQEPGAGRKEEGERPMDTDHLLGFLRDLGLYQELADAVEQAVESGMTAVAAQTAATAAAALAETVAYPLIFLVIFLLVLLIWSVVSHLLDLAFRLPVLNTLNRLGGGAFGLLKGVLVVFVLVWLMRCFALLPAQEELAQTTLLRFFANTNPLTLFLYGQG